MKKLQPYNLAAALWGISLLAGIFFRDFPARQEWNTSNVFLIFSVISLGYALFSYGLDVRGRETFTHYFYVFKGRQVRRAAAALMLSGVVIWLTAAYAAIWLTIR